MELEGVGGSPGTPASPSLAPSTPQPTGHWLWGLTSICPQPRASLLLGAASWPLR